MLRPLYLTPAFLIVHALCCMAQVQDAAGIQPEPVQVVVSASSSGSPSAVAIPPATSWTATIGVGSSQIGASKVGDVSSWVEQQNALNGEEIRRQHTYYPRYSASGETHLNERHSRSCIGVIRHVNVSSTFEYCIELKAHLDLNRARGSDCYAASRFCKRIPE
jgi:hypothetical protein